MIIITTVGTSLLTNLIKDDYSSFNFDLSRSQRTAISTGKLTSKSSDIESAISIHLEGDNHYPKDETYGINLNTSAEIKSICKIADGKPATVYLLATDTFMSEYAAEQITEHLNSRKELTVINKGRINGLKIDDPKKFEQTGFEELINELEGIRKNSDVGIVLNISGGYKALIPFMTIYAQLMGIPIKYIYEASSKVISIGNVNLNFDWALMEALRPYLVDRISQSDFGGDGAEIIKRLKENYLVLESDDKKDTFMPSPLGRLLVNSFHDNTNLKNSILGTFLEYKYFEFFCKKGLNPRIASLDFDLPYSYEFSISQNKFVYDFLSQKALTFKSKSGDIDLILEDNQDFTLVEVKNYHTFLSYKAGIGKYQPTVDKNNEDYYRKIKGKIEAYKHETKQLPAKLLILVNLILFEKDNRPYEKDESLIVVSNHFKKSIAQDYGGKICFEAKICRFNYVDKKKFRVNYDKLLRTPIEEIDFCHIELN